MKSSDDWPYNAQWWVRYPLAVSIIFVATAGAFWLEGQKSPWLVFGLWATFVFVALVIARELGCLLLIVAALVACWFALDWAVGGIEWARNKDAITVAVIAYALMWINNIDHGRKVERLNAEVARLTARLDAAQLRRPVDNYHWSDSDN